MLDTSTSRQADLALFNQAAVAPKGWPRVRYPIGLIGRMLVVTVGAVLFAMMIVYLTRLEINREFWIHGRINSARAAIAAFDLDGSTAASEQARKVLDGLGVVSV